MKPALRISCLFLAFLACACGADASGSGQDAGAQDSPDASPGVPDGAPDGALPETCTDIDGDGYGEGGACDGPDCNDSDVNVHPGQAESCNMSDDDCDSSIDEGVDDCCSTGIDNDFDGVDQCLDCDDSNGARYPGAAELCNGLDDDCDGITDEGFDSDGDGFNICGTDPLTIDCDDNNSNANPGAAESCDLDGTGNGVDENCNGIEDEGCSPDCNAVDTDGDGTSECDGDCAPDDPNRGPGLAEICDGIDNDCNLFTVENCGVSDRCNWDLDGDFTNDPDQCEDDLLCGCVVGENGCEGDYRCTSFCNTSETGDIGDGCGADMTCLYDLLDSANIHGCAVSTETLGTTAAGEACTANNECRSNRCGALCTGPDCDQGFCIDYCASDAYCDSPTAICRVDRLDDNVDGSCWPIGGPFLGASVLGDACTLDTECDHGLCSETSGECTEACCQDSDCGVGFSCTNQADQIATADLVSTGQACTLNSDCDTGLCNAGQCAFRMSETSPMCVPDVVDQDTRRAGASCAANADCASNFCDADLGVCVDVCCSDAACPSGLGCELQLVEVPGENGERWLTQSRVCVATSTNAVLSPL
jgi:hypothetical protein